MGSLAASSGPPGRTLRPAGPPGNYPDHREKRKIPAVICRSSVTTVPIMSMLRTGFSRSQAIPDPHHDVILKLANVGSREGKLLIAVPRLSLVLAVSLLIWELTAKLHPVSPVVLASQW